MEEVYKEYVTHDVTWAIHLYTLHDRTIRHMIEHKGFQRLKSDLSIGFNENIDDKDNDYPDDPIQKLMLDLNKKYRKSNGEK